MKRKLKTEGVSNDELDKMILYAAEQKLLPKLVWDFSKKNHSNDLIRNYQKSINKIYARQTSKPLKYNPQQAKSHRQKFKQKVQKLLAHELPIDYLQPKRYNGEVVMTYKDNPLEKVQYPTKNQFKMFREFSDTNFKKGFTDIFEDRLEYEHRKIFQQRKKRVSKRNSHISTCPDEPKHFSTYKNSPVTADSVINSHQKHVSDFKMPKITSKRSLHEKSRILSSSPSTFRQIKPRRVITSDQDSALISRIKQIGGYSSSISILNVSLTKQSILRYLKQFYQRPHRIVDFLNISAVSNYQEFRKIPQKLKLMQNQHMYFMVFLFFDSNNDGYICNQDLLKMSQLIKKCPLIQNDIALLRRNSHKVKFQNNLPYKQLYKIPDLTQTKYFNWYNSRPVQIQQEDIEKKQIQNYFKKLNRKSILIHYDGFKKIYKKEKPYFWYDLCWRLCGLAYDGIDYQ